MPKLGERILDHVDRRAIRAKDEALKQLIFVIESAIMLSDLNEQAKSEMAKYVNIAKQAEAL